ncbi:MAG: hypothetical protein HWQ38_18040 [Nostoc sp. NMS7]|uniref:hypothetical protein n=1 Tax=Nostoc sp. NMS7 TaxID=2815391 RepID=UPI0025D32D4C|nr:hypothetical protein [Nostoc sp. NMS7]MBN3948240.1 hypothetical protein [Nostoc sp. NMS7]
MCKPYLWLGRRRILLQRSKLRGASGRETACRQISPRNLSVEAIPVSRFSVSGEMSATA